MIHKVKPPVPLTLVHSSKESKNDLGGQSGESYSQNPASKEDSKTPSSNPQDPTPSEDKEAAVHHEALAIEQQVGLTQVVKEWMETGKTGQGSLSPSKISQKYQGNSTTAKGMLLNKKFPQGNG